MEEDLHEQAMYIVYKMLLYDLSWIPIVMQSCISVSYVVFEIRLSKPNYNNNDNNFEN